MEYKDYYRTLGVSKSADDKTIKAAYRRLARKYHPDVNKGHAERFKEINEAYTVLSDPEKRKRYDTLGSDWEGHAVETGIGRTLEAGVPGTPQGTSRAPGQPCPAGGGAGHVNPRTCTRCH